MNDTFHGEPIQSLQNSHLRLDYLTQAGPRLVRLIPNDRQENLLAEVPERSWDTPHGLFRMFGGHRLWIAPEEPATTYQPDTYAVQIEPIENGVRLIQPQLDQNGLQKTIEVVLVPDRPQVALNHIIEHRGKQPVEVAPWAITQMRLGGVAVLPLPERPSDPHGKLPNRSIILWPYSRLQDPRYQANDREIMVSAAGGEPPFKVGGLNLSGWIAYLWEDVLFVKEFAKPGPGLYPDMGCNVEVYTSSLILEMETLGRMHRLQPGESIQHSERWTVFTGVAPADSPVQAALRARSIFEGQRDD